MDTNAENTGAVIPDEALTVDGLKAFLASPYVKGVGKVYASKLVDRFGRGILSPEFDFEAAAAEIPGLGTNKAEELKNSLSALKIDPTAAILLYSAGMSDVEVEKILSHYGKKAVRALIDDPYDMVENAWKVSFFTADKLGRHLHYAPDNARRIRGALLTAVKFYAEKGNVFATEEQALTTAANLAAVPVEAVKPQLEELIAEERLIRSRGGIYLPVYYIAEIDSAAKLTTLIKNRRPETDGYDIPQSDIDGHPLNEDQIKALKTVMTNPVTVITGGPGTGKTTTIRGIIKIFEEMDRKVILAAPTGRAAKRMADLAGTEAKTIHRLLGYNMGKGYRNKKFDADVLVIDEASMLEQVLFKHLLDAVGDKTRIVLVGDTHQLPPIGAGDVLQDLIKSETVPIITLKENFRQKEGSMIATTAEAIKSGANLPAMKTHDFMAVIENSPQEMLDKLISLVKDTIPEKYGVDCRDIQVVTPQNDGPLGAKELNPLLQQTLNPTGPEIKRRFKVLRLGDRVMQTSNSAVHNVFNGETGRITAVDTDAEALQVTFHDGKRRWYHKMELGELSLAYALTVHKLQGSETDYLVMVLPSAHRQMLYRNLLYTGISRARKLCVLITDTKALDAARANTSPSDRNTNLAPRLRHTLPPLKAET